MNITLSINPGVIFLLCLRWQSKEGKYNQKKKTD